MKFSKEIETFITDYVRQLEEENAVIFAGAGLSVPSGFVNWKTLLKDFAEDLELNIDREDDLVSLAQYYLNKHANNRHALNQAITDAFHVGKKPNANHEILARLPINTYWTTNYDKLIEKALEQAGKVIDVKYTKAHLARTVQRRDAVLYKMHGDVDHPDEAILAKDQYEKYYETHAAYITALSGDLVSKTFLFIGFSFSDPNLDYILSRLRVQFKDNQRHHYCFFKELSQGVDETPADFDYRKVKQALAIRDLQRFNIRTLMVNEYAEITEILEELERRYKRKTVFVSGSAHEYGWERQEAEQFIENLSQRLIQRGFKIVSGFGLGVGSSVIQGVLQEVYLNRKENLKGELLLRPFPQGEKSKAQWEVYRRDMIAYAGIAIFIFGNKLEGDVVASANGVLSEYEIAKSQGLLLVPIGATGYVAEELWHQILADYGAYFENGFGRELFEKLGDREAGITALVNHTIDFVESFTKQ